jgi:hypothetical protein
MANGDDYIIDKCDSCGTKNKLKLYYYDSKIDVGIYKGVCKVCGDNIEVRHYYLNYN